jgi:prevent-host-death family protein
METIRATTLRKSLYETLERVKSRRLPVEVVLGGLPAAVLVPVAVREPGGRKPPIDLDAVAAFCQEYRVRKLSLFGSILRSDFNATSDVDVLVDLGDRHVDFHEMFRMVDHLEAVFGRRVDMVEASNLDQVDDVRRQEITSTARAIYEQESYDAAS